MPWKLVRIEHLGLTFALRDRITSYNVCYTKLLRAGGAESMSRGGYWLPGARWGQRMGDGPLVDAMVGALTDPFDDCHMGITAENIAAKWKISYNFV